MTEDPSDVLQLRLEIHVINIFTLDMIIDSKLHYRDTMLVGQQYLLVAKLRFSMAITKV